MKNSRFLFLIMFIITIFIIISCKEDEGSTDANSGVSLKTNIDIEMSQIDSFIKAPGLSSSSTTSIYNEMSVFRSASSENSKLFVVLNDDTIQQVELGEATSNYTLNDIYLTDTYIFLKISGLSYEGIECSLVPIRRTDGTMFCINETVYEGSWGIFYQPYIQKLPSSDIFYIRTTLGNIVKLDLTDPENASKTTPFSLGDRQVKDFIINSDGDALIWSDGEIDGYVQVFKATGGFVNVISSHNESWAYLTVGPSGYDTDFYFVPPSEQALYALTKSSDFSKGTSIENGGFTAEMGCGMKDEVRLVDKVFAMPGCTPIAFYDITLVSGTSTTLDPPALVSITKIFGYDDKILVLGKDGSGYGGIVEYDVTNTTWTTLLTPGSYTISKMSINSTGEVLFYGIRNSDSAAIVGKITAPDTIEIISENEFSAEIEMIIRIN